MALVLVHARFLLLETLRVPVAVVGTTVFPAVALLFFVAANAAIAGEPTAATAATAQLAVFSVLSTCLFTYGVGVAEDRALPWEPYVRTLPVGPGPRLAGRLLTGLAMALLGLAPLVVLAGLLTAATLPPARLLVAVAALVAGAAPFLLGGLAIGYALPVKAALPVANLLLLPLAFGGGLFLPPETFPAWLDRVSVLLPTRGARDLVVAAATDLPADPVAVAALPVWVLLTAALAGWAYRRDEGQRFR